MTTFTPVNIDSRKNLDLRSGDTVRVHQKIEDKGKTRIQIFEGMVLARKHGGEPGATFTVRRSTGGYGVEKIYPLYSPMIDKIEIVKRSKIRRSKLYYVRDKALKQMKKRLKMMFVDIKTEEDIPEPIEEEKVEESVEVKEEAVVEETSKEETPVEEVKEEEKKED